MADFKYILKIGSAGQEVKRLQRVLGEPETGKYTLRTSSLLKVKQNIHSVKSDGIFGPITAKKLGIEVLPGIDVSSHNGNVDFKQVKNAGIEFAYIKLTEGSEHVNPNCQIKYENARKAKVRVGAYHFARPDTSSGDPLDYEREATNFLNQLVLAGYNPGDLIPALDFEDGLKTDDNYNLNWMLNWGHFVKDAVGDMPIMYTAKWAWDLFALRADKELKAEVLSTFKLWVASYNKTKKVSEPDRMPPWEQWHIWQYSGYGSVPGITGRVDLNWMAGGQLENLIKK